MSDRDDVLAALRAVIAHWDEFGPEYGFSEVVDGARAVLARAGEERPSGQRAGVSGPQEQGTGDSQRQPGAPQPVWRITTDGKSRWYIENKHQQLGPLFYANQAIAVRDALNRVAWEAVS